MQHSACLIVAVVLLATATDTARASDEIDILRDRYVKSALPSDPKLIARLNAVVQDALKKLNADGSFSDIDYTNKVPANWPVAKHLDRVQFMAEAYRIGVDAGTPDAALKAATLLSLRYWLDHDLQNPNWWWNQIGVPMSLGGTSLVLGDALPANDAKRIAPILERARWKHWTGQNLVWGCLIQFTRGVLTRDESLVEEAFNRTYEEVFIAPLGKEGIQADYSFHQHGEQLYSGSYGLSFTNDVGRFVSLGWGTSVQIPAEKLQIFTGYLLEGQQWMIYGTTFDYSGVGREIVRKGKRALQDTYFNRPAAPRSVPRSMPSTVSDIAALPVPRQGELKAFAARLAQDTDASPLVGTRAFWRSDYLSSRGQHYLASVKMLSNRMTNAELTNMEGRRSHHLSEGTTYFYVTGEEYRDIFPVWDWNKVPGVTAEQAELTDQTGIYFRGEKPFVGSVTDGRIGLAAMDFKRGPLTAKKAWVFLDGIVVCVGAGIDCDTDNDVTTSINQCLLKGEVVAEQQAQPRWMIHDRIGYIFTDSSNVKTFTGERSGDWTDIAKYTQLPARADVFALWLDHGTKPHGATYAYAVCPDATPADMDARRDAFSIIENTPTLQAVRDVPGDAALCAFWAPGEVKTPLGRIAVDQPSLVIARRTADGATITACNPENKALKLNVKVGDRSVSFDLPDGLLAGSSVTKELH